MTYPALIDCEALLSRTSPHQCKGISPQLPREVVQDVTVQRPTPARRPISVMKLTREETFGSSYSSCELCDRETNSIEAVHDWMAYDAALPQVPASSLGPSGCPPFHSATTCCTSIIHLSILKSWCLWYCTSVSPVAKPAECAQDPS